MKAGLVNLTLFLVFLSITGCVPYQPYKHNHRIYEQVQYNVDTSKSSYSDKLYSISITPLMENEHYRGFNLDVTNKTNKELKIVWNDTYYTEDGTAGSGFMFKGIQYLQRNSPKMDMLILPNSSAQIDIYPNDKIFFIGYDRIASDMGFPSGWQHGIMKGEVGTYVKIKGTNFEKSVQLTVKITTEAAKAIREPNLPDSYYVAQHDLEYGNVDEAVLAYQKLNSQDSDSPKASDILLKQALFLDKLGQKAEARTRMQELLIKFPNSEESLKAKEYLGIHK